ncbi:MAG TPA: VWA domain-containing protein [Aromatoleum sp.]|uniref:VWA domain-containing protein n=1 Tax=Aromatoleum sp. TaxID=2307007 RepID=UPI002B47230E|nr:VWA domain-containing protein [Aromatoleum sp.]HJV26171.1 VWA domain-containing protein [Aromatoleum sp.]
MTPELPSPLLFAHREAALAPLDALARKLWLGSLINSQGRLEPRLTGLVACRDALVAGDLPHPDALAWPQVPVGGALAALFSELDLPAFCEEKPELADQLVSSLLWHLDRIVDFQDRGDSEAEAVARMLEEFGADWRERCGVMHELTEVFGDCDDLFKNANWDQLQGTLKSDAWQEVVRTRRLIERLPELAALIRGLGRMLPSETREDSRTRDSEVLEEASAPRAEQRVTPVPELPGETCGVYRSGRIARMLPVETMLLTNRRLRRLRLVWHARHAERTLLSYEDNDRLQEVVHRQQPTLRPSLQRRPERRLEMGPLLVCVDTSGSMRGGAEAVAKAIVLEAARTAFRQKRRCHVFCFGGPDEIVELEMSPNAEGIERLTRFLGQSFSGGTDICGPLERAIGRLADAQWQLADLLIASDGEFGATREVAAAVERAKAEQGLRVQGVLIGDRETIGFLEVADDIYWLRDWRHFGGSQVESPVHSKSLTAMYFPGALRSPENRAATVVWGKQDSNG